MEGYVAKGLMRCRDATEQHVLDLIEEGKLQAINIGGGGRYFCGFRSKHIRHFQVQITASVCNLSKLPPRVDRKLREQYYVSNIRRNIC